MTLHRETREVELCPERAFELVADVESYPAFLPSWQEAHVVGYAADGYDTEQTVGVGLLARHFHTHTTLDRPRRITVTSHDDVFRHFDIIWEFQPAEAGGCRIDFTLDFAVESWLLAPAFDMLMIPTASSMISAFQRRAQSLAATAANGAAA